MTSRWLYWPSLLVAAIGGVIVVAGALYEPVRVWIVGPLTVLAATIAVVLFLRILFDPKCHRGIDAANREMMGGQGFHFRRIPILDPQWGLFGSRVGSPLLLTVRAVLGAEVIVSMLLASKAPALLLLAFASLGVAMLLSLLHLAEATRRTKA